MARPMTHRERRTARKAWAAFKPDKEYGAFMLCTAGGQVVIPLKQHMEETIPDTHWHKVTWPIKVITPELMSIGWMYTPQINPLDKLIPLEWPEAIRKS